MPGDRPYTADELALMTPEDVASMPPDALRQFAMQKLQAEALRNRAAAPQQQGPPPMDDLAFLASLTPERRAEVAGMGTLDQEGGLLADQLAEAQALANRPMAERSTLGGAIGSGLAGVLDSVSGGLRAKDARQKQEALLRRQDALRAKYQDDVVRFRNQQQQRVAPGMGLGDAMLPPGMG